MNQLIANVDGEFKNVLSESENIISPFDENLIEAIWFTPTHKLETDEWFVISDFSTQSYFIKLCEKSYSTASLSSISNAEYSRISYVAIIQDNQVQFERITPSLYVNRKTLLDYSGQPAIKKNPKLIEIHKTSDAIYLYETDKLYFKSVGKIKKIFPGIEELEREATREEVEKFLGYDFVQLDNYSTDIVGPANRKRIADIGTKYSALPEEKKKKLIEYSRENSSLVQDNGKFKVGSETDLKNLLWALDERYYYAEIYEEKRVANSVRVVEN